MSAAGRSPPGDTEPSAAPPWLSVSLAVGTGTLAAVVLTLGSELAGAVGLLAVAVLLAALAAESTRLCSVAAGGLVLAVVTAGATGATPAPLVAGGVLAVTAWDVADHGLGLGRQVGHGAVTRRNELVHAVGSLAVGGAAGGAAFGGYLAAAGGQPVTALTFLLLGSIALLAALRS